MSLLAEIAYHEESLAEKEAEHERMFAAAHAAHEQQAVQKEAEHARLLEDIFEELSVLVPGFDTFRLNLGILISSPGAQVYYHADVPGQSLWHIRGEKRVYLYPNRDPFLPEDQIERIVLSMTEAEIDYQPWFDDHALVFDLKPGEMLHWPLNAPHRVENLDSVNISVII